MSRWDAHGTRGETLHGEASRWKGLVSLVRGGPSAAARIFDRIALAPGQRDQFRSGFQWEADRDPVKMGEKFDQLVAAYQDGNPATIDAAWKIQGVEGEKSAWWRMIAPSGSIAAQLDDERVRQSRMSATSMKIVDGFLAGIDLKGRRPSDVYGGPGNVRERMKDQLDMFREQLKAEPRSDRLVRGLAHRIAMSSDEALRYRQAEKFARFSDAGGSMRAQRVLGAMSSAFPDADADALGHEADIASAELQVLLQEAIIVLGPDTELEVASYNQDLVMGETEILRPSGVLGLLRERLETQTAMEKGLEKEVASFAGQMSRQDALAEKLGRTVSGFRSDFDRAGGRSTGLGESARKHGADLLKGSVEMLTAHEGILFGGIG